MRNEPKNPPKSYWIEHLRTCRTKWLESGLPQHRINEALVGIDPKELR